MEREVAEVMALIARARQQTNALTEEVMDKKCELYFLATQGIRMSPCPREL